MQIRTGCTSERFSCFINLVQFRTFSVFTKTGILRNLTPSTTDSNVPSYTESTLFQGTIQRKQIHTTAARNDNKRHEVNAALKHEIMDSPGHKDKLPMSPKQENLETTVTGVQVMSMWVACGCNGSGR
jgi:hypothetical protein